MFSHRFRIRERSRQTDAGGILDIAMAGTSATLLARKWESAILVNVDNDTLKKIMASKEAMEAIMNIEGFRALGSSIFETVVNKSEAVRDTKKSKGDKLSDKKKKELSDEEKEYKSKRKQIQEKLIKFVTRIPAFSGHSDSAGEGRFAKTVAFQSGMDYWSIRPTACVAIGLL